MVPSSKLARPVLVLAAFAVLMAATLAQTPAPAADVVVVQANCPGAAIAPTMFGVFFEVS